MQDTNRMGKQFSENVRELNKRLRIDESYDLIGKDLIIGGRQARLYFIDGFAKDEVMEKILEFLMGMDAKKLKDADTVTSFINHFVTYVEADPTPFYDAVITGILSGTLALLIEGYSEAIMIDARTYPARSVSEPEDDRVLRGSHDGFVETLVHNTALIRRRIRDPNLTMDITRVGSQSKTDIVVCYIKGKADEKLLSSIKKKLNSIEVDSLTLSQESLLECLVKPQWYNPFPKVRYTERPDAASASLIEGSILILTDNSPSVMILPTSLLDFVQDTNDFYFPPMVGTYLRSVRMGVFALTLFLTPIWLLLIQNPQILPEWLEFIKVQEPNGIPIIFQLLIIEFVIDGLKLASLNTPNVLSNSFSIVGALILGDFAVKARWFVPEVVLYMAFVAIATFTQPSFELGYALKIFRVILLGLISLLNWWGFILGIILMIVVAATTKTVSGNSYLYPLIPFNWSALSSLLIRKPIKHRKK